MRRTGIFGGTFNPVHTGHLINIEFVRDFLNLDRVLLIPAKDPVHKKIYDSVTPDERLEMVKLAVSGNKYFEVSGIEIERDTSSYTLYTLNQLKKIYPDDEFYLIIGSDSFNELDTWKSFQEILERTNIVVIRRPGDLELRKDILEISVSVTAVENPEINISSTEIRNRVRLGKSIKYLVPDAVLDYINIRGLYRN